MKTFEVKILGQRYRIRSDENEDYIQDLAKYVAEKIGEVQASTKTVATHNLAILAALNIADEVRKVKIEMEEFKKEIRERIRHILRLIRAEREAQE